MLTKRTILNRNFYKTDGEFKIKQVSIGQDETKNKTIVSIVIEGAHDFSKNGELTLYRNLDDGEYFSETFKVESCTISGDETTLSFVYENFNTYYLRPSYIRKQTYCIDENTELEGTEFVFDNFKHICIKDRGKIDIKNELSCGDALSDVQCDGYVLYDSRALYAQKSIEGTDDRVFTLSNINSIYDSGSTHVLMYEGEAYNIFVPYSYSGYDNRTFMLVLDENVDFDLNRNFTITDCRFFDFNESNNEWFAHPNVVVREKKTTLNLQLPLSFDFNTNLYHDQLLEDYVNDIKDNYVTKPLDYEKTMFTPVYYDNSNSVDLNSIRFNIFLRKRHFYEETMEWKLDVMSSEDSNETISEDSVYWNSYEYDINNTGKYRYSGYTANTGDLLGDLGFDDNDVLNQNKRLSKTFIRLLFFDKKDRNSQTLLYYSTIFINTSDLHSKYIKNITNNIKFNDNVSEYVDNIIKEESLREQLQLSCNFTCFNKHNMNGSSEGYYLYLFPSLVNDPNLEDETNTGTTDNGKQIYMRIEFNHAKYGKTIPLIWRKNDTPLQNYTDINEEEGRTKISTNLAELYDNMYIPITIKYDSNRKSYVWFFSNINEEDENNPIFKDKNNPTFNMWEPKVR